MEQESRVLDMLKQIGIRSGQTVLDFGCGYGAYTIPVAEIVGEHGKVYALDKDKEALDALMQRGESAGLKNIDRMETSGELEIGLTDESVDVVLLFDVLHSNYFSHVDDRRRLLDEIYRVMKPSAFISIWPKHMESGAKGEVKRANFHLESEHVDMLIHNSKDLEKGKIINFRKDCPTGNVR